jgi:hypothetical protein
MTTRVTFSNGEVCEYDEETEAHPSTGDRGVTVVLREYAGPTPPRAQPGETVQQQRDRLRAELAALGEPGSAEGA